MPSPLERAWLRADRNPCSIPESWLCTGSQAILSKPGDVPNSQSLSSQITNTCVYTPKKETFWYILSRLSMSSLVCSGYTHLALGAKKAQLCSGEH